MTEQEMIARIKELETKLSKKTVNSVTLKVSPKGALQTPEETMADPNDYNIPTDSASRDSMLNPPRFEQFTDGELMILGDALRELLQVKTEALEIANADLGSNPESPFTEQDFGIPAIEAMLTEIEALQ